MFRDSEILERLDGLGLVNNDNPNVVIAPRECGYSELLGMLGSMLPDQILRERNIERPVPNFWLWPIVERPPAHKRVDVEKLSDDEFRRSRENHLKHLGASIPVAFEQWIWTKLVRSKRFRISDFAETSSLRMLAGDVRFWMHRLYRIAMEMYESFPPTTHEDDEWIGLDEIEQKMRESIPSGEHARFQVTRPRVSGYLWDPHIAKDREEIGKLLLDGETTVESLEPVVEVLLREGSHEDFSDRYSWVKEDFERAFYSKRTKIKVTLHEFIDECPVHDGIDTPGYDGILFRDLMAFFNQRDQTLILALREGQTKSQIAERMGHAGHAAISRRVKAIEQKVRHLLANR
jgi:hypothetical protein